MDERSDTDPALVSQNEADAAQRQLVPIAPAPDQTTPLLKRKTTRRAVIGGTLAATSAALIYAALGDKLDVFGGGSGGSSGAATQSAVALQDADAISKESVQISHLLRRTGFGVTRDEFDRYQSMGKKAVTDELVSFTSVNDDAAVALANAVQVTPSTRAAPAVWWLVRMANTKRPLQEKMTFFWHNLLTSQISVVKDPTAMVAQNELYRAHALDTFPSVLHAVTADPAMMVYLDLDNSQKSAPNENYARELMELFSLGVGNYSETDVREAARAFTGWQVPKTRIDQNDFTLDKPVFRPQRFDSGSKTFLGHTGNLGATDVVDIITQQPASAAYIVRRLFSFFIYPQPSDADIAPFVDVYNQSKQSIGAVVEAMLRSDVFYSPQAYRAIVKSPVEYAVGALKALGLQGTIGQALNGAPKQGGGTLGDMGQIPFEPPNVAGWPGGRTWLNSATIFARLNFLNQISAPAQGANRNANQRNGAQPAPQQASANLGTPAQALSYYLPLALDDNLPDEARQVLLDFGGGSDAALAPDKLRSLVYLMLGSPQFHLA